MQTPLSFPEKNNGKIFSKYIFHVVLLLLLLFYVLCCMIFNSLDELWDALQTAFAAIPRQTIMDLYGSMHCRLAAVIVNKEGHTKYCKSPKTRDCGIFWNRAKLNSVDFCASHRSNHRFFFIFSKAKPKDVLS